MVDHPFPLLQCVRQRFSRGKGALLMLLFLVVGCGETATSASLSTSVSPPILPPTIPSISIETEITGDEMLLLPPAGLPEHKWQAVIGDGLSAPAVLASGWVVVASKTAVIALDPITGTEQWRVSPPDGVRHRSLAAAGDLLVVGVPGQIMALRAADGEILWQQPVVGDLLWPPLIEAGGVYAGTAFVGPGVTPDANGQAWVYALDVGSGEVVWSQETAAYTLVTPVAGDDMLFVGGSLLNEDDVEEGGHLRIHAFDKTDGTAQWAFNSLDGFLKSLATDGKQVYFLAYTDMLYGLDAASGEESWRYPTENWSPGFSYDGGTIYMGSDNAFVHAVDGETGTAVWRTHLEGVFNAPRGRPMVQGKFVFFQGNDNRLYCLDRGSGGVFWMSEPQPRSRVALTIGYKQIFLVDQDGNLHGFGN